MVTWIKDEKDLQEIRQKDKDFFVLAFYGSFSSAANRAMNELEEFSKENEKIPLYAIDVGKVKGIHKQFGVKSVPTVIALEKGKVTRRIEGVESSQFYAQIFLGARPLAHKKGEKEKFHRVVVYSTASCPWCATTKNYLRRKGVPFRDVDVGSDQQAAQRLVQRSGQTGVPQVDIDGHLIVGFNQAKIDLLLSK